MPSAVIKISKFFLVGMTPLVAYLQTFSPKFYFLHVDETLTAMSFGFFSHRTPGKRIHLTFSSMNNPYLSYTMVNYVAYQQYKYSLQIGLGTV